MLPLSLASATSTLVAQSIGARQPDRARDISSSGIRLSAILAIIVAVTVWLAKDRIIRLYTASAIVAANASPLFLSLCSLLFFDAIQVTSSYVLRALQSRSGPDASVCPDTLVHRTRMRLHIRFRARSLPDTIKDHRLIRFLVQQLHQSGHSFGCNEHSVEKNRKAGLETH